MEVSVRYVQVDDLGQRPVIGVRGEKSAHVVGFDLNTIYSRSIPLKWFDTAPFVMRHNDPYPIKKFIEHAEARAGLPTTLISPKARKVLEFAMHPDQFDEAVLLALADDPETDAAPPEAKIGAAPPSEPGKPRKAARKAPPEAGNPAKRGRGRPAGSAGTGVIAKIAAEFQVEAALLRKACRAAGMKAPYEDTKAVVAAWKKHGAK